MGEYELVEGSGKVPVSVVIDETVQRQHVRSLERSRSELALDFIMGVLPWLFVALAIAARSVDGEPWGRDGARDVAFALTLAPTVFPILFAAICGRFMRSLALFKSQSGLRMKHLEHLTGAQSIFTSLERLFFLRNFSTIGIIITLIWCLSPLGGQAFIRLLPRDTKVINYEQNVAFLSPIVLSQTMMGGYSGTSDAIALVTGQYLASLLAPGSVRNSARDLWNNPKLPIVNSLNDILTDVATPVQLQNDTHYKSLIGIPIGNLADGATSKFEIESVYLHVTCRSSINTTIDDFANTSTSLLRNFNDFDGSGQTVVVGWQLSLDLQVGAPTAFLYANNQSVTDFYSNTSDAFSIYYGSMGSNNAITNVTFLSEYTVAPVRSRANVTCRGQQCEVTALRKIALGFDPYYRQTLVDILIDGTLAGIGAGGGASPTPTELFLTDPETMINPRGTGLKDTAQIFGVSLDTLSERMSLILNTYYYVATSALWTVNVDNFERDWNAYLERNPSSGEYGPTNPYLQNVTGQFTKELDAIYSCQKEWFAIALITSLILAAIAVANVTLRLKTKVPDVFGYASSLTLHNQLCQDNGLARSSALDGMERAIELRDVKFRIADIRSDSEIGRMAFVPVSDGESTPQNHGDVRTGRLYD